MMANQVGCTAIVSWNASGHDWSSYIGAWPLQERMHAGREIIGALGTRFQTRFLSEGPYFFSDLGNVSEAAEQVAIDAGHIQATGNPVRRAQTALAESLATGDRRPTC